MQNNRRQFLLQALSLSSAAIVPFHTFAQSNWPNKPIKIVVPVPAGASLDNLARTIAKGLSEKLGQSVIVENMAGGGSNIAFGYVSKATLFPSHFVLLPPLSSPFLPAAFPPLPLPSAFSSPPPFASCRAPPLPCPWRTGSTP